MPQAETLPPREDSPGSPGRRFAIGDGMILVALAACLSAWFSDRASTIGARAAGYVREAPAIVRHLYFQGPRPPRFGMTGTAGTAGMVDYLRFTPPNLLVQVGLPVVFVSTFAYLMIRLRRPRPPWGALLRQPGMVAMLAALAEVLIEVDLRWFGVPIPTPTPLNLVPAILGAWLVLVVTRRWRAEPGWVDRLGRAIGVGWVVVGLLFAVDWYRPG